MGSAPKRKNIDIQRYTRVGLGCQFTSNLLSFHHMHSSSFTILHFFEQEKTNMTWKKKNVDKRIYRKQFLVFCEYFTWQRDCVEHILLCKGKLLPLSLCISLTLKSISRTPLIPFFSSPPTVNQTRCFLLGNTSRSHLCRMAFNCSSKYSVMK